METSYAHKKVIVTGGMGFVGRNLVDGLLLRDAKEIVVVDDCSNSSGNLLSHWPTDRVRHIRSCVTSSDWFDEIETADIVFHLACKTILECHDSPLLDLKINAESTLSILEKIRSIQKDCRPVFIYTSSACVYGVPPVRPLVEMDRTVPTHQYGVSKLAGENYTTMYANIYGLNTASLRLSNVYGSYQTPQNPYCGVIGIFLRYAEEGKALTIIGDGLQSRDFTYADDAVHALLGVGLHGSLSGEVYNISAGNAITINELADAVIAHYPGLKKKYVPKRVIDDIPYRLLDSTKVRALLGVSKTTPLHEGIRKTMLWVRDGGSV